jgi:hypothetical protein
VGYHVNATTPTELKVKVKMEPRECLTDVMRRVARRVDRDGGAAGFHHRCVCRLHRLVRGGGSRDRDLSLAVREPTKDGISSKFTKALREGALFMAVDYEVDDGGHGYGDLLIWEPALPSTDRNLPGRLLAVECKRLLDRGNDEDVSQKATRTARRIQSWLAHLCFYDESIARCVALRDGSVSVAAATLTEDGVRCDQTPPRVATLAESSLMAATSRPTMFP